MTSIMFNHRRSLNASSFFQLHGPLPKCRWDFEGNTGFSMEFPSNSLVFQSSFCKGRTVSLSVLLSLSLIICRTILRYVFELNPYAAGGLFGHYKMMQKSWKMTETLANGYSSERTQREQSNEYQHGMV